MQLITYYLNSLHNYSFLIIYLFLDNKGELNELLDNSGIEKILYFFSSFIKNYNFFLTLYSKQIYIIFFNSFL